MGTLGVFAIILSITFGRYSIVTNAFKLPQGCPVHSSCIPFQECPPENCVTFSIHAYNEDGPESNYLRCEPESSIQQMDQGMTPPSPSDTNHVCCFMDVAEFMSQRLGEEEGPRTLGRRFPMNPHGGEVFEPNYFRKSRGLPPVQGPLSPPRPESYYIHAPSEVDTDPSKRLVEKDVYDHTYKDSHEDDPYGPHAYQDAIHATIDADEDDLSYANNQNVGENNGNYGYGAKVKEDEPHSSNSETLPTGRASGEGVAKKAVKAEGIPKKAVKSEVIARKALKAEAIAKRAGKGEGIAKRAGKAEGIDKKAVKAKKVKKAKQTIAKVSKKTAKKLKKTTEPETVRASLFEDEEVEEEEEGEGEDFCEQVFQCEGFEALRGPQGEPGPEGKPGKIVYVPYNPSESGFPSTFDPTFNQRIPPPAPFPNNQWAPFNSWTNNQPPFRAQAQQFELEGSDEDLDETLTRIPLTKEQEREQFLAFDQRRLFAPPKYYNANPGFPNPPQIDFFQQQRQQAFRI